jgi:chaperone required for assembly of F1-ATPase
MRRFYKAVAIGDDGTILLDGRTVKTPARNPLISPGSALGEAMAQEWRAQGDTIDPRSMPLTGLANAAIDHVAPDPAAFAQTLAAYAETDLLCYRADEPPELVARQASEWDPLLDWARTRYDIAFEIATGIVHIPQPETTVARLAAALSARDAFRLAALSPLITIGGSLVTALALAEYHIDSGMAFATTHLDELWQEEKWGEDSFAAATRAAHRHDFEAAARFLALLDDGRPG